MITADYCDAAIWIGLIAEVGAKLLLGTTAMLGFCLLLNWLQAWRGAFRWRVQISGKNCRVVRQNLTGRSRFQFSKPMMVVIPAADGKPLGTFRYEP